MSHYLCTCLLSSLAALADGCEAPPGSVEEVACGPRLRAAAAANNGEVVAETPAT